MGYANNGVKVATNVGKESIMHRHEVMKHFIVDTYYVVYFGASSVHTPGSDGLLYSRF